MPRLAGIEFEWTDEQKRILSGLTNETTGALVGVSTDRAALPNEFGRGSSDSAALLGLLHETNADVASRLSGTRVDLAAFLGVLAIAMAW